MSLRLVIPGGLLSSRARFRFTSRAPVCCNVVLPVEIFSANGEQCLNCLCQPRGQAQEGNGMTDITPAEWESRGAHTGLLARIGRTQASHPKRTVFGGLLTFIVISFLAFGPLKGTLENKFVIPGSYPRPLLRSNCTCPLTSLRRTMRACESARAGSVRRAQAAATRTTTVYFEREGAGMETPWKGYKY